MNERIKLDESLDPGGLISESYRIDGLGLEEARSIFLDWAIKLSPEIDPKIAIRRLLAIHAAMEHENHPMTLVLQDGLGSVAGPAARRGGSRARRGERS